MKDSPSVKVYYDHDADLDIIKNNKIGIIGYGIQGRAQSLNLRDSNLNVKVGNRIDEYYELAINDGFEVLDPPDLSKWADIIFYLIPDDAQVENYEKWIKPYLNEGDTVVFAHGYAIYHNRIILPENIDILLLAPRMPGRYIRNRYLNGWGAPVFIDVHHDYSGIGQEKVLALAKGIGATRIGAMQLKLNEETEIDLFIELYLLPRITHAIQSAFDFLIDKGFTPEAVISELYASKEIGELIKDAGDSNLYQIFMDHASPTCQFGKMENLKIIDNTKPRIHMEKVLNQIRNGEFDKNLKKEGISEYANLNEYNNEIKNSLIVNVHNRYNKLHKKNPNKGSTN